MKTVVIVRGGVVQKVLTDVESEIIVIDYDTEGSAPEEVSLLNGTEVLVSEKSEVNSKEIHSIIQQVWNHQVDIPPLSVKKSALSSMNYFFLRFMKGKSRYPEEVMSELESYLNFITPTSFVDKEIRSLLISEMQEGDYFTNMQLTSEVKPMLKAAILTITGDVDAVIFDEYFSLIKESLAENITLLEEKKD